MCILWEEEPYTRGRDPLHRLVDIVGGGQKADLLRAFWKVGYDAKPTERRQTPNGRL